MKKILALLSLPFLLSCAGKTTQTSFDREVHPHYFAKILKEEVLVHWSPMDTLDYQLKKACNDFSETLAKGENTGWLSGSGAAVGESKCLGTSASNAMFEYNQFLREAFAKQGVRAVESFPGVGPLEERDTLWNVLLLELQKDSLWTFERWKERDSLQIVYENPLDPKTRLILARLRVEYGVRFLWTPLQTRTYVWAENSGEGEMDLWHHLALWDLETPSLLYLARFRQKGPLREGQKVDKNLWLYFFKALNDDLKFLKNHWEEELRREPR